MHGGRSSSQRCGVSRQLQAELSADLCQDRGVLCLHHGVNDTLRVNDNVNVVIVHSKQVVSLNDLQAFVHQGCRIYGYFAAHAPVGVL